MADPHDEPTPAELHAICTESAREGDAYSRTLLREQFIAEEFDVSA